MSTPILPLLPEADETARGYCQQDVREIQLAAYQAGRGAAQWQPIETAPKDGTDIMLTDGEYVTVGHWYYEAPSIREHRDLEGRWIGQDESDGYEGWLDWLGGIPSTHWMPLPPFPKGGAQIAPKTGARRMDAGSTVVTKTGWDLYREAYPPDDGYVPWCELDDADKADWNAKAKERA